MPQETLEGFQKNHQSTLNTHPTLIPLSNPILTHPVFLCYSRGGGLVLVLMILFSVLKDGADDIVVQMVKDCVGC